MPIIFVGFWGFLGPQDPEVVQFCRHHASGFVCFLNLHCFQFFLLEYPESGLEGIV